MIIRSIRVIRVLKQFEFLMHLSRAIVNLYKEREFISPNLYKIHRCFLLEVFVSESGYFGRGLKDRSPLTGQVN